MAALTGNSLWGAWFPASRRKCPPPGRRLTADRLRVKREQRGSASEHSGALERIPGRVDNVILEIDVQTTEDQIPIVRLKGEIDLHTCGAFRDTLRDLIENKSFYIVVDLAEVPYLDSAALGVLVDAVRRVREHDGSISLVSTTPFVRRAFEITRLVKIFHLYEDTDAALTDIRQTRKAA